MIAFEIEGGKEAAFRFQNALRIIRISNNLGDAKSLITHPATTTHFQDRPGSTRGTRHLGRHSASVGRPRKGERPQSRP